MRTKRSELKEQRQGIVSRRSPSCCESIGSAASARQFGSGQLKPLDSCYELIKMIAGAGVGLNGIGGVGMLRARRRDISVKLNRKLDRKSSRGVIYENEELRLRAININAEVEQSQNDIKKLRRENEQLRREIWSLRDEYDKLEEILKKQKYREKSDEPEDRSGNEICRSDSSNEEEDDEEDEDDESDIDDENAEADDDQEERLENAENQKISSEKKNTSPVQHRTLAVVEEVAEEEPKSDNKQDKKESIAVIQQLPETESVLQLSPVQQPTMFPYHTTSFEQAQPITTTSYGFQTNCPFIFPSSEGAPIGFSNVPPYCSGCTLTTMTPQLYSGHQQFSAPVTSIHSSFDVGAHNLSQPALVATPPPPPGWQNNSNVQHIVSPITAFNFPVNSKTQYPIDVQPKDTIPNPYEDKRFCPKLMTLAERRKAFFKQRTDNFVAKSLDTVRAETPNKNSFEINNRFTRSIGDWETDAGEATPISEPSINGNNNKLKHFFAPLSGKSVSPVNCETNNGEDATASGNSSGSERTASTVISRSRYEQDKEKVNISINETVPSDGLGQIESGDAKAFFSSENLLYVNETRKNESRLGLSDNHHITRSASWQDLSSRLSFHEDQKSLNQDHHLAKSDITLDNISINSKKCKSHLNVTQKQLGSQKSISPDTPEVPKLPTIDYKLFNNPFLQDFQQAYQNFPVRTEGQSPLSIRVCESPVSGAGYSSPIRMQPTFTGPSIHQEIDCNACKRKDLERLRLTIPTNNKLLDADNRQEFQITSFETPSPHTLQIPPMTPYELEALRKMPTPNLATPNSQTPRLYQNVPFVPGQAASMSYDTQLKKITVETQTSTDDRSATVQSEAEIKPESIQSATPEQLKKRPSRKEKSGSVKEKSGSVREKRRSPNSQRRKDLKKQGSTVSSKDIPDSPSSLKPHMEDESRSSSSESPKKDHTKRVSLYFSARKRPSLTSTRTSRSRSVENSRLTRTEVALDTGNSERERTNSTSSREAAAKERTRKNSTSSGNVPWCACWGNGCI